MSFSYDTKNELCRLNLQRSCCARGEAYGILLYCSIFHPGEVRIVTENHNFAARLPKLFQKAFSVRFDRQPDKGQEGKLIFQITQKETIAKMINALGFDPHQNAVLHINYALLEDECCRTAFLRGAFMAGGSVTDPTKRYHLELVTSHLQVSREMETVLLEQSFVAKCVRRTGNFVTYFKHSEHIEDFLTLIGAPVAAMELMNAKMEKELRNKVNRRLNCDNANVDKAIQAAHDQMQAIHYLEESGVLETLNAKLQQTAAMRLEYEAMPLSDLAELFDPPVSKSCLNHRLRKLMDLYKVAQQPDTL